MLKHKSFFKSLILASWIVTVALAVVAMTQAAKIRALQVKAVEQYEGLQFATIQYTDDYTGELITVQGALNFEMPLQPIGDWMYEFNGVEAVLTGARVIGNKRVPYSTTGNVAISFSDGEFMSLYGTVVKPLENDSNLVFYMVGSELTDRENIFKDFLDERGAENEE